MKRLRGKKSLDIGVDRMDRTCPRRRRGHFYSNIKCSEMPFGFNFLHLRTLISCLLNACLLFFYILLIAALLKDAVAIHKCECPRKSVD